MIKNDFLGLYRAHGFTLAEVLITLGIIGIVAAMTLPTLIEKHQKKVVVTRLQKFYTNINQAIKLSEVENGPAQYWEIGENGQQTALDAYNKYLAKYLKTVSKKGTIDTEIMDNNGESTGDIRTFNTVFFADGSAMKYDANSSGFDISFYPDGHKLFNKNINSRRNVFSFNFRKANTSGGKYTVEPYSFQWDGTRENLFSHPRYGCRKDNRRDTPFCAKLIQYDGWEIKDDYPW